MRQDWMIDFLADLRSFVKQNGMKTLSKQLNDTILVAAAELSQGAHGGNVTATGYSVGDGAGSAGFGRHS